MKLVLRPKVDCEAVVYTHETTEVDREAVSNDDKDIIEADQEVMDVKRVVANAYELT